MVALVVVFAVLWHQGHLLRFSQYVQETQDELRKCTWPTRDELKGSTVVVIVSVALLGIFTVFSDQFVLLIVRFLTSL
jgi:preprotein translocase subunit SecE